MTYEYVLVEAAKLKDSLRIIDGMVDDGTLSEGAARKCRVAAVDVFTERVGPSES